MYIKNRLLAVSAALALSGCMTVAQIQVDRGPVHTHWSFLGGMKIEAPQSPAIGAHFVSLGGWAGCGGFGIGTVSATCIIAGPNCNIAILGNVPQNLEQMKELQKRQPAEWAGCVWPRRKK